jgi:peptidyl-prolyl cis-trans isomerase C
MTFASLRTFRFFSTNVLITIIAFSLLFPFLCSCQKNNESKAVATVNGEKIFLDAFRERFTETLGVSVDRSTLKREDYDRLSEEILKVLIDEQIMLLRARELKITADEAEVTKEIEEIKEGYSAEGFKNTLSTQGVHYDAWKNAIKKRMTLEKLIASDVNAGISVTEEEARTYYDTHRTKYALENRVHISQIVLRDEKQSENILNRLKRGEPFGKVAKEVSIGLEAAQGGDLGFIGRGIMPEPIDAAIFSLSVGAISKVIRSPYGYHIFKIIEKKERGKEFTDIKAQVISDIKKQKEEQAYVQWLSHLRSQAVIKVDKDIVKMETVTKDSQRE